jgi:hypothetical protein
LAAETEKLSVHGQYIQRRMFHESVFNISEVVLIACWSLSAVRDCALIGTVVKCASGGVWICLLLEPR